MKTRKLQKAEDALDRIISFELSSGFGPLDRVVDVALDAVAEQFQIRDLRPHAERILAAAIRARRAVEKQWPPITDCDRLDSAFAKLEEAGIVSRQNFSCCGMCGVTEMYREIVRMRKRGQEVRGYTFYHVQDTESAMEGDGLHLNYGSILPGEKAALSIGHDVAAGIRAEGLKVEWDGTWGKRIGVQLDWKRRLPQFGS
jgi:hypothetical protein